MIMGGRFFGRLIMASAIALMILLFFVGKGWAARPAPQLSTMASVVTGRAINVFCEPGLHPNVWTWTKMVPRQMGLSEVRCDQLEALIRGLRPKGRAKQDFAEALGILLSGANSAAGLGGNWEGVAISSCKAVQQLEKAARALGIGERYGRSLAVSFAKRGYWSIPLLFPTPDCYPGGPMDFHLGNPWPNPQPPPPGYGKG